MDILCFERPSETVNIAINKYMKREAFETIIELIMIE
jgi:hypothetical protein